MLKHYIDDPIPSLIITDPHKLEVSFSFIRSFIEGTLKI